jgi:hypothetical protein
VHDAVAPFDQVTGVSDADRALAFANIQKPAPRTAFGVVLYRDPERCRKT